MILPDTSVWADHFRRGDEELRALLLSGKIIMHPYVRGEIALGSLHQRARTLASLDELPEAMTVRNDEVFRFIERHKLYSRGVGFTDVHLLASVRIETGVCLWTRDKRLREAALDIEVPVHTAP